MRIVPAFILIFTLIATLSCDTKQVYQEKKDFRDRHWVFSDPARFDFEITDADRSYNLLFHVRNTAKYQFQNIYLQYYLEDSTGRMLSRELKNIQLFNSITGVPLGKGLGDLYDIEKAFLEDFRFEYPGKYRVQIDQFMRQDSLPEILSVGLRVEYAD